MGVVFACFVLPCVCMVLWFEYCIPNILFARNAFSLCRILPSKICFSACIFAFQPPS